MPIWLLNAMFMVVLVLVLIAVFYRYKLYLLNRRIRENEVQREQQAKALRETVNQSIQIICRSLLAEQVESAEASLRISALLDRLGVPSHEREQYVAIDTMAASIRHIPILEGWKALDRKERRQYELLIYQKQSELDDFIRDAARKMLNHNF